MQTGTVMANAHAPGHPWHGRSTVLWWGYFALSIALFGLGFVSFVIEGRFASLGAMVLTWALSSADAICIAGLFAFILSTPLFAPMFWKGMLALLFGRILVSMSLFALNLFPWEAGPEQNVALAGLACPLLSLPMLVALWTYAFKSPHIWNGNAPMRAVARAS